MIRSWRKWSIVGGCFAALLVGCGTSHPGWGTRVVSWDRSEANKATVPGIDAASVRVGTYGEDRAVAFWTDANNGVFEASVDKDADAVVYHVTYRGVDGRTIDVKGVTNDGKTGRVHIDGQEFNLEDGGLFLISTIGGTTTVKQDKRDLAELLMEVEALRALSDGEGEIRTFFNQQMPATTEQAEQP